MAQDRFGTAGPATGVELPVGTAMPRTVVVAAYVCGAQALVAGCAVLVGWFGDAAHLDGPMLVVTVALLVALVGLTQRWRPAVGLLVAVEAVLLLAGIVALLRPPTAIDDTLAYVVVRFVSVAAPATAGWLVTRPAAVAWVGGWHLSRPPVSGLAQRRQPVPDGEPLWSPPTARTPERWAPPRNSRPAEPARVDTARVDAASGVAEVQPAARPQSYEPAASAAAVVRSGDAWSAPPPSPADPRSRPWEVTCAVLVMCSQAGLVLLVEGGRLAAGADVTAPLVAAVIALVQLLFAAGVAVGQPAARTAAVVLEVLSFLLGFLAAMSATTAPAGVAYSIGVAAGLLADVAVVALLLTGASRRWFRYLERSLDEYLYG